MQNVGGGGEANEDGERLDKERERERKANAFLLGILVAENSLKFVLIISGMCLVYTSTLHMAQIPEIFCDPTLLSIHVISHMVSAHEFI